MALSHLTTSQSSHADVYLAKLGKLVSSHVDAVRVEGAARETWEEANCQVEILAPYSHFDIPVIGQAYILFRCCIYVATQPILRRDGTDQCSGMQQCHCQVPAGMLVLDGVVLSGC